jgi:hypothetical protein
LNSVPGFYVKRFFSVVSPISFLLLVAVFRCSVFDPFPYLSYSCLSLHAPPFILPLKPYRNQYYLRKYFLSININAFSILFWLVLPMQRVVNSTIPYLMVFFPEWKVQGLHPLLSQDYYQKSNKKKQDLF